MVGKTLGHYEILEPLGKGGMGEVYRARDTTLDRDVAIKVLPEDFATDPERLARFEREAKAVAAIDHPNIVTVHSVEETDGYHFITMQLVEGRTLSELLPRHGFGLEQLFEVVIPLAEAVSAAHQQGITHRDLKPANIMVSNDGRVRVLDFGLAKLSEEAADAEAATEAATGYAADLTEEGKVLGTVAYMAPEQAEGKQVDPRSDVFSLGIILYEAATGERPFKGDTRISVVSSIVKEAPTPATEVNRNLPRHLGRIINKCLEKDATRRYQTAQGLRNDLEELKAEVDSGAMAVGPEAYAGVGRDRSPFTKLLWGTIAVAAIAGLAWTAARLSVDRGEMEIDFGITTRVTGDPGLEIYPAISPNGELVAYSAGPLGQMRIYLREAGGGQPVPLTADFPGDHRWPRWSPDGTELSFESEGTIYAVGMLGGPPRVLVEVALGGRFGAPAAAAGSTWSPTGGRIAFIHDGRLMVKSLESDARSEFADPFEPNSLSWSPDGSWIAYVSGNTEFTFGVVQLANIAPTSIWLMPAGGGDPVALIDDGTLNVSPVWLPDSRHILFISDKGGGRDVYSVTISDSGEALGDAKRLSTRLDAHSLTVTADGTKLIYSELSHVANIWSIRIPRDGEPPIPASEAVAITTGSQTIEGIGLSLDGQWLAFDSNRSGNQDIYKMRLPGGAQEQLTVHQTNDFSPSWSPDGEEIAFYSYRGSRDLYVMSAAGTSLRQVTDDPAQERHPDWSPDGNQLIFRSDQTGREEIWIVARTDRASDWQEPRRITDDGGRHAQWSPDGKYIAYGWAGELWIIPPEGREPRQLAGRSLGLTDIFPTWGVDSGTVYFKGPDAQGTSSLWSVGVAGGAPKLLVEFDNPLQPSQRIQFATDGTSFYFTIADQQSDIFVTELIQR